MSSNLNDPMRRVATNLQLAASEHNRMRRPGPMMCIGSVRQAMQSMWVGPNLSTVIIPKLMRGPLQVGVQDVWPLLRNTRGSAHYAQ